jgi:transcription elongation factor GreA
MVQRETYLTPEGLKQLEEELDHLKSVRRQEVASRIHKASGTGGTVDNAEYDEAKNEQAFAEGRIRELENILSNVIVAPSRNEKTGVVEFGSSVRVVTAEGAKRSYKVVGSAEAAPLDGKISNESPVGRALLGHKVGDEVEVETPSGVMKLTIKKIT